MVGYKNVWIFIRSSSTGEWVFNNGLTKAIKDLSDLSGTILVSEPPVSVSDELAAFGDPDRDEVFVVSVKDSNQVAKYEGATQGSNFGGSVTVADNNYLAVSTAGTNPSVVINIFPGSSSSETFNPSTTTTNSPLMVRSSGGAESVIVGDSSTGKAFVYSRGCPAGQYTSVNGCTDCSAGEFSVGAADATCSPCAAGSYSGARSMQCTACAPGKFANSTGSSQCAPCPGGLISISSTYCQPCERGKISVEGACCNDCASGSSPTPLVLPLLGLWQGHILRNWWGRSSALSVQWARSAVATACRRAHRVTKGILRCFADICGPAPSAPSRM